MGEGLIRKYDATTQSLFTQKDVETNTEVKVVKDNSTSKLDTEIDRVDSNTQPVRRVESNNNHGRKLKVKIVKLIRHQKDPVS